MKGITERARRAVGLIAGRPTPQHRIVRRGSIAAAVVVGVSAAALALLAGPAQSVVPGANGKIAFTSDSNDPLSRST